MTTDTTTPATTPPEDPRLPAVLEAIDGHVFKTGADSMGAQCICGVIVSGSRALADHIARETLALLDSTEGPADE